VSLHASFRKSAFQRTAASRQKQPFDGRFLIF
jgi:hypothetical protein